MEQIFKQILTNNLAKINLFLIGKSIIELILFLILIRVVNKALQMFFDKIISKISHPETRKQYSTIKQLGVYIVDAILILFFATNILGNFGIDMKPILATAGVLGVAVGFGAKKFVEDLFTGLSIILTGQIRVGDFVTINNSTGTVEKVTLTMVIIRTFNGDVHFMRNGQIDTIVNQTKDFSLPLFNISVAYNTNINHLIKVLKELSDEIRQMDGYSKYILSDLEIFGLNEFQDSSIVILARFKTTPHEQWMVKRKFNQMIKERFEQEGIEIPFPQVVVTKANTEKETIE